MRKFSVAMVLFPGFQLLDIAWPVDGFVTLSVTSSGSYTR